MVVSNPLTVPAISPLGIGLADDNRFRSTVATRADYFDRVQAERAHLVVSWILHFRIQSTGKRLNQLKLIKFTVKFSLKALPHSPINSW